MMRVRMDVNVPINTQINTRVPLASAAQNSTTHQPGPSPILEPAKQDAEAKIALNDASRAPDWPAPSTSSRRLSPSMEKTDAHTPVQAAPKTR
jgi:hypothetical protein